MNRLCYERESLVSVFGVCLRVLPSSHQKEQSGWELSMSLALRAVSNPDPNPRSSSELIDWNFLFSAHSSHSHNEAQLTISMGRP